MPFEDFLLCLSRFELDPAHGYLPPSANLKEVRLDALWRRPGGAHDVSVSFFLLQERDALTERTEVFILVHGPGQEGESIRDLALQLKAYLERRQTACLFRMDPRYGLVHGSALEPIDGTIKWDRPGGYAALYLTSDPRSPSIALLDYVPQTQRDRYRELFQKYNHLEAASPPGVFRLTWTKLRGKSLEDEPARKLNYRLLRVLAGFLKMGTYLEPKISLIFKDLPETETEKHLLDPRLATFSPAGNDRFFSSLGELA